MPQTTPERAARWPGGDQEAIGCLEDGGWMLSRDGKWQWTHPDPTRKPTGREIDAAVYLIEEWDFGGMIYAE
ncbi:hypothetical protein Pam3_59 [Pseudanabaena phage Pam3]|nr:hypothetical protein Pam3_59 [Pseudanabaena phage Pam3]